MWIASSAGGRQSLVLTPVQPASACCTSLDYWTETDTSSRAIKSQGAIEKDADTAQIEHCETRLLALKAEG